MRALALVLVLSACASQPVVPRVVATCPSGTKAPPAPREPRTVASLARWSIGIELAREATQRALDECAARLRAVAGGAQ